MTKKMAYKNPGPGTRVEQIKGLQFSMLETLKSTNVYLLDPPSLLK